MRHTRVKRYWVATACLALGFVPVGACAAESTQSVEPQAAGPEQASSVPIPKDSKAPALPMPCNPGAGFPEHKKGCPDRDPEQGWLSVEDGNLVLAPFRTLGNNAEGKTYAHHHGEDYPFANDYFDAPVGTPHSLTLNARTVCTGIIMVGYREPLDDHVATCEELTKMAERMRVPVAVWATDGEVVQVSELYRP